MGHIDILCQYHLRLHSTVFNTAPQFQCTGCGSIYALCVHVMMTRVLPLPPTYGGCRCSWALQIRGAKRWWLRSPLVAQKARRKAAAAAAADDGGDDGGGGVAYEFVQQPGEILFFCPGWWHSTYVEEEDDPLVCSIPLAL